jgi:hypothetical protein
MSANAAEVTMSEDVDPTHAHRRGAAAGGGWESGAGYDLACGYSR